MSKSKVRLRSLTRSSSAPGRCTGSSEDHFARCTLREIGTGFGARRCGDAAARASLLRLCIFSLAVPLVWVCKASIHFYRPPAVPQNCPQSHSHDDQRARAPSCEAWVFLSVWEFDVGISAGKLGGSLFGFEVEALCESSHGNYGTVVRFPDARLLARLVRKMHRAAMVSRPAVPPPPLQADRVAPEFGAIFRASVQAPQPATAQDRKMHSSNRSPVPGLQTTPTFS